MRSRAYTFFFLLTKFRKQIFHRCKYGNRDSEADVTTTMRLDNLGFESQKRQEIFSFSKTSIPAVQPTQPPIQWTPVALSPGEKNLGRKADRLPPFSAEVNLQITANKMQLFLNLFMYSYVLQMMCGGPA
jgi:hypothetical protein